MSAKIVIRFTLVILSLALALGYAPNSLAITTNGNGGTTDVGTWYNQLMPKNPPGPYDQWSGSPHLGVNNLPLVQTSSGAAFEFQQYDSSNAYVLAQDMANLAQAEIDFIVIDMTNGGLAGLCSPGNNWTATYAGDVMTAVNTWNSMNTWQIRVAFAIGAPPTSSCGGDGGPGDIEAQAEAIYTTYENSSTYNTPINWYQIDTGGGSLPVLVIDGVTPSAVATYCASNSCTNGINHFQLEYANAQGAGEWGWNLATSGTAVDPAGLVEHVSPGWINYVGSGSVWDPRNDGAFYQDNWDVVFNNTHPRIVILTAYNDWIEQQGFGKNDTMTPSVIPSPPWTVDNQNARLPEVWTLPDGNVTLDGYWNYTVAAINYLRGGTSSRPSWPQPAPNLAPLATASAYSCAGGGCTNPSFMPANAADGNPSTMWSSDGHLSALATEWIQLHYSSSQTFNTVVLMGRGDEPNCFPVSFKIQVLNPTSGLWDTPVQETNFPQPTVPGTPIAFSLGSSYTTTDVKVTATQLRPDTAGNYYFQLGEFEVLNETSTASAPVFANWGFEAPALNGSGDTGSAYVYGAFTNGWTFGTSAGVQQAGSAWASYMPPQGVQTAFIQNSGSDASISQSVVFPAGTCDLRFLAAQRYGYGAQTFTVSVDGTVIYTVTPSSDAFAPYVTPSFTSSGGAHTITFNGTASSGNGFLDEVQIFNTSAVGTNLLADPSWASGGFSSWNRAGTTSAAYLTAGGGFNGDPYVLNENSTSGTFNVVAYQDFYEPTLVGHTWTASVYAQTSASTSGAYVGVQDGAGLYINTCSIPAGQSSWTLFYCTGIVPADGKLRFELSSGPESASAWTKLDNASLIVQ